MNADKALAAMTIVAVIFIMAYLFEAISTPQPCPQAMPEKTHLPSLCKQYYYDEGDAWIECMGVGRK